MLVLRLLIDSIETHADIVRHHICLIPGVDCIQPRLYNSCSTRNWQVSRSPTGCVVCPLVITTHVLTVTNRIDQIAVKIVCHLSGDILTACVCLALQAVVYHRSSRRFVVRLITLINLAIAVRYCYYLLACGSRNSVGNAHFFACISRQCTHGNARTVSTSATEFYVRSTSSTSADVLDCYVHHVALLSEVIMLAVRVQHDSIHDQVGLAR